MEKLFNGRHFIAFNEVADEVWDAAVYELSRAGHNVNRRGMAAAFRIDQKKLKRAYYGAVKSMGPHGTTFVKDSHGHTWEVSVEVRP